MSTKIPKLVTTRVEKMLRCVEWLKEQNTDEAASLQNKNVNDIDFIVSTNADRKNFYLSSVEDDMSVPAAVDETPFEQKPVPIHKLRSDNLRMECGWKKCGWYTGHYDDFQKHVRWHLKDLEVVESDGTWKYLCLWDVCGFKTNDGVQMTRHVNYHAYHSKLLAIGFNARFTFTLEPCKRDSAQRNKVPPLTSPHQCMWSGCTSTFDSIQFLFDHVKQHERYAEPKVCSWGGCGFKCPNAVRLHNHLRSHTLEKLIACYHCGGQFTNNRRLLDHLRRQNVQPTPELACTLCGVHCATEYLLREHTRRHVSFVACSLCDWSTTSAETLALHMRYRHLERLKEQRAHSCPHCDHRSVTKWDMRRHIATHFRKKKKYKTNLRTVESNSDTDSESNKSDNLGKSVYKKRSSKKYVCHMCEKEQVVYSRGSYLTTHLLKEHGIQRPGGHVRFRYQKSDDGMYRLTTTRYESLEVSKQIVDRGNRPLDLLTNFQFDISSLQAADNTPVKLEIKIKDEQPTDEVEITTCDVDEDGNIIREETVKTGVLVRESVCDLN